jgi:hypothetical protein
MSSTPDIAPFPLARSLAMVAGGAALAGGAAALMLASLQMTDQIPVALTTLAATFVASAAGLVPVWLRAGASLDAAALAFVFGMLPRIAMTTIAIALAAAVTGWNVKMICGWTAGWYMVLVAMEVAVVARYLAGRDTAFLEKAA